MTHLINSEVWSKGGETSEGYHGANAARTMFVLPAVAAVVAINQGPCG